MPGKRCTGQISEGSDFWIEIQRANTCFYRNKATLKKIVRRRNPQVILTMTDTVLNILHIFTHLIITIFLLGRYYYYPTEVK